MQNATLAEPTSSPKSTINTDPAAREKALRMYCFPTKVNWQATPFSIIPVPPPFKTEKKITPYGIALVEFENEKIQVAGIMVDTDLDSLKLGMEMETTTLTMFQNEEKQDVVTWAFRAVK